LILLAAIAPLAALKAATPDERLRTVMYDPDRVVRIVGHTGIQSTIEFGPDERIENIAIGDSAVWQVTPNRRGSVVFLKPLSSAARTNMTVVTDKRTYLFDLIPGAKDATPLYALKFLYPAPPTTPLEAEQNRPEKPSLISAAAQPSAQIDALNFGWRIKGDKRLKPSRVFDDGRQAFVAWPSGTPLPAVLTRLQTGEEAPLNFHVSGDYVVISPVPAVIVLRYGRDSSELTRSELPPRQAPSQQMASTRATEARQPVQQAAVTMPAAEPPATPRAAADKIAPIVATDLISNKLTGGDT
jgi:type IV secretion system protein VirB9